MKKFRKEFEKKLISEDVKLPESLSAENIERLINEKGGIVEPKRKRNYYFTKAAKWCSAAAAAVILVVGVGAVVENANDYIPAENQEQIIEDKISKSDYSEIEKSVLTYYKEIYNEQLELYYTSEDADGFDMGSILDNIGAKNEAAMDSSVSTNSSTQSTGSSGAAGADKGDFSETNTQVEGVDEADIIKNDGRYIYYLTKNTVTITDCSDAKNMKVVSRIKLFETDDYDYIANEMFLHGDKLIAVFQHRVEDKTYTKSNSEDSTAVNANEVYVTCDCCLYAMRYDTLIYVYDISDKASPEKVASHKISGDYVSSRIADGKLVAVTNFSIPYEYIRAENFEDSCAVLKDNCIPEYTFNGKTTRIPAQNIKLLDEENPSNYTVTAVMSLENDTEMKLDAFLGGGTEIYCTQDELFVAESLVSWWQQDEDYKPKDANGVEFTTATRIYKFDITDEGVKYITNAVVGGIWLNQFSMDKHGNYFRIATNGSEYRGGESFTMVYVLDENMNTVGYLGGIAKGEDMKAARFLGNTLYLVTFYQTDPLFVIDMSDPTSPEIKGELKIPGFSSYLHPIGNGLVIGLGEGGTMNGADGTAKISLFDVSDPYNPKELDNYSTNVSAYFINNHKAFVAIDENTFAMPLGNNYAYLSERIIVFTVENGSILIDGSYDCCTGNSVYESARASFINDTLFAVNSNGICAYDMVSDKKLGKIGF